MASAARRSSFSGDRRGGGMAAAAAPSKRPAAVGKPVAKKRPALGDISNKVDARRSSISGAVTRGGVAEPTVSSSSKRLSSASKLVSTKRTALSDLGNKVDASSRRGVKGSSITSVATSKQSTAPTIRSSVELRSSITKLETLRPPADQLKRRSEQPAIVSCQAPTSTFFVHGNNTRSPARSGDSLSQADSMSLCDSMKSPDIEYVDSGDSVMVASLDRRAIEKLHISDDVDSAEKWKCAQNVPVAMDVDGLVDIDNNFEDPQLCAVLAPDIYKHLRDAETKKRPTKDYMERVQKDINPSMRAILVDWLVEVAEEYRLVPDTLYLTINYIDRYLSGNEMNRQRLQLLGVACMLIASKYEEICAPQVEEFCYITDNTYFKDEVLQMESTVLHFLKFEVTAPTAKCFLRRFIRAAQVDDEAPLLQLEFVANYVAELSLLEYNLLRHPPSLVAASSVFMAKFILNPTKHPWSSTLTHYTRYKPSELADCIRSLHRLVCNGSGSNLPAIREKYSQHKYKYAAKKFCPPSIPAEFFKEPAN